MAPPPPPLASLAHAPIPDQRPDATLAAVAAFVGGTAGAGELARVDPALLAAAALAHGLGPMLLWRLREAGADASEPAWQPLVAEARASARRYLALSGAQAQLEAAFRAAETLGIWFKGIALARTVYPQPALRPMADLDVLVPAERRRAALGVARSLGYHATAFVLSGPLRDVNYHYCLRGHHADGVSLEIHHRFSNEVSERLRPIDLEWFVSQARECILPELTFHTLSPEAHLLFLCAHAALQHATGPFRLQRYFDLHALLAHSPAIDWNVVVERASRFGWLDAVATSMATCARYFRTPLPPGLRERLESEARASARPPLGGAALARDRVLGTVRQLAIRRWPWRVRLLFKLVFPPAEEMRQRFGAERDGRLWLAYLRRWVQAAREIAAAVSPLR